MVLEVRQPQLRVPPQHAPHRL
uniref:Uncharacterized protein n=1 Tax=Zea mays TaxID=4577 RepID=C4J7Y6_MAIZE|nr:unknown [Zea mays]